MMKRNMLPVADWEATKRPILLCDERRKRDEKSL